MTRKTIDINDEQNLLINAIVSTKYDEKILGLVESKHLKVSYSKLVLKWIKEYFDEYHEAPGKDLAQIWFNERASQFDEPEDANNDPIKIFCSTLSKKYEEYEKHNINFQIDETIKYLNLREYELLKEILNDSNASEEQISKAIRNYKVISVLELKEVYTKIGALEVKPPQWLIKYIMEENSVNLLYGEPGVGKSFIALDIGASIATGVDFHTNATIKNGPVIYIAAEGRGTIARRCQAWALHNEVDLKQYPFFILNVPIQLLDEKSLSNLEYAISEIADKENSPQLIIIDTWNRSLNGDENSNSDCAKAISALDKIRSPYNCSLLLVHHSGHQEKKRARGASALNAAVDNSYLIEQESTGEIIMKSTKCKDGEGPKPICFELENIALGLYDEHKQEITSAFLNVNGTYKKPKARYHGKNEAKLLEILKEMGDGTNIDEYRNQALENGFRKDTYSTTKKQLIEKGDIDIIDRRVYFHEFR